MKLQLYSTHCPHCKMLERILEMAGLEYELIDNIDEVNTFAKEHNLTSAPIFVADGKVMDFMEARKFINSLN